MMTSRERLLRVLNGEVPDRTPITLFVTDTDIEDGPPNCVLDRRTHDTIEDLIRFHEILGIDIMLRISVDVFEPIAFDRDTDDWVNAWEISSDRKKLTHTITTPEGRLTETFGLEGEEFHGDPSRDWMKLRNVRTQALIKDAEDLQMIKKYRPQIPDYDLGHIKHIRDRLGDRGIVLPRVPSSVFNSAFGLRKLQDLFIDPLLNPDLYRQLMEFCANDVIEVGKAVAQAGGDVMRIVGNVANSGMVGGSFYLDHIFPYEKRYIDALASDGIKVLFHNCGQCAALLEVYREMLDGQALESLSTAGSGGDITSLRSARDTLGDRVVMVGNFDQVHLLRQGTKDEITAEVRKIFEETMGDQRFIFSTSDSIVPGTPKENIETLVAAALQCAQRS
ncbi:MAG TPA: uroporphyrinogen decarboxylase family protein [Sedimentisphaerales bacterium]|nr:uroporphyrinogen decarboxylase family protein [Sedimentisphaerales bacterium]